LIVSYIDFNTNISVFLTMIKILMLFYGIAGTYFFLPKLLGN